jgi:hypothetical protein
MNEWMESEWRWDVKVRVEAGVERRVLWVCSQRDGCMEAERSLTVEWWLRVLDAKSLALSGRSMLWPKEMG